MSEPTIRIVLEVPASMTIIQLIEAFAMMGLNVIFRGNVKQQGDEK